MHVSMFECTCVPEGFEQDTYELHERVCTTVVSGDIIMYLWVRACSLMCMCMQERVCATVVS